MESIPELVVDITSPSTARTNSIRKLKSYLTAGTPHDRLVGPDDGSIEFELRDTRYVLRAAINEVTLVHPSFPGLTLEMTELFA